MAKKSRTNAIKKTKVFVLGGGDEQVPYIQELKRRGFWLALTDINESAPGLDYADEFSPIGYEDTQKLLSFAASIGLTSDDYIFTASAQFAHIGAAFVAENFGISYPTPRTIEICLNKTKYYREFQKFGIPIPNTSYISDFNELRKIVEYLGEKKSFYLKSDYSKNPNYIYRFNSEDLHKVAFYWGRDRYLRDRYVLQEEVQGRHLRLNIFPGGYNIFDFRDNSFVLPNEPVSIFVEKKIKKYLSRFLRHHLLASWVVKFDLIVSSSSWVALDIGLDPPNRMKLYIEAAGHNFVEQYVNLYLKNNFANGDLLL